MKDRLEQLINLASKTNLIYKSFTISPENYEKLIQECSAEWKPPVKGDTLLFLGVEIHTARHIKGETIVARLKKKVIK